MGFRSNFSQAMKEFKLAGSKENSSTNANPDAAKIKDVASYMADDENEDKIRDIDVPAAAETEQEDDFNEDDRIEVTEEQAPLHFGQGGFNTSAPAKETAPIEIKPSRNSFPSASYMTTVQEAVSVPDTFRNSRSYSAESESNEVTVIAKNTLIDGNIRAFGDMEVNGNVKGNIETTKNITVSGKVVGNISSDNAVLKSASVQGNITLKGQMNMSNDSMIIGNLNSQSAYLNGKVKGDLNISGKLQLDKNSVIFGNVNAGAIAIADGAILEGKLSTTYLSKDESSNIFPECIPMNE